MQDLFFSCSESSFRFAFIYQRNLIEPGKRPLSSMSPSVVYSEAQPCEMRLAIGGTNGPNITLGKNLLFHVKNQGSVTHKTANDGRLTVRAGIWNQTKGLLRVNNTKSDSIYNFCWSGVAEVILNAVGFGETLPGAVDAKRFSPNRLDSVVSYEGRSVENLHRIFWPFVCVFSIVF